MLPFSKKTIIIGLLLVLVAIPILFVFKVINIYQAFWSDIFFVLLLIQFQSYQNYNHGERKRSGLRKSN